MITRVSEHLPLVPLHLIPAICMMFPHPGILQGESSWKEDCFADFRDGTFMDAGSNLYVSAAGRLQIINRWDLNGDGNPDIVLPAGHGHTEHERTFIYLNQEGDIDGRTRIELPGNYAKDAVVADFDKDGRNDLAIANYADNHYYDLDTWIFYGTDSGYSADHRVKLPAYRNRGITSGDFNGDGWLDIAVACEWQAGGEWQNGLTDPPYGPIMTFVYWNSKEGFSPENKQALTFESQGAMDVTSGDLDHDGLDDLVFIATGKTHVILSTRNAIQDPSGRIVLPFDGNDVSLGDANGDGWLDLAICQTGQVLLLYGKEGVFDTSDPVRLEVSVPKEATFSDVDSDGLDDLLVANFSTPGAATWTQSHVFFSDGKDFSTREALSLPTLGASGVSAGDLNGDGRPEMVVSNSQVTNQFTLLSYVFWNENGTYRFGDHSQLRTEGSIANTIGDINNDGWKDVVFIQYEGGFRDGPQKSYIYWGDGTRNFSITRRTGFNTQHIFGYGHADLDDDGHLDLLLSEDRFISGVDHEQSGIGIQWGSHSGFIEETNLSLDSAYGGMRIADLNRDGYLDLVCGGVSIDANKPGIRGIPIFWGSATGFRHHNRSVIPFHIEKMRGQLLMDLNKDGYLDITGELEFGTFTTWWGGPAGFDADRQTTIRFTDESERLMYIKGADLNKDGWLDLLLPHRGPRYGADIYSYIYYGGPDGFSNDNRELLSTTTPYDNSIADFNKDGWLDIFLTSYAASVRGNQPSLVYWGSPRGFNYRPPMEINTLGASGTEALDYDGDGWIDVFVSNHRQEGSLDEPIPHRHTIPSMLYWGGPDGFTKENRWEVEGVGVSGLNLRDPGNSYDRGLYEDYISSPHRIPDGEQVRTIKWEAETPHGSSVVFRIRVADTQEALESTAWTEPDGSKDSWIKESGSILPAVSGKWIQYLARLQTPNGAATPYLTAVEVQFK